jgi:hypothetical protein
MTPKLKLSDDERKPLLFSIRKLRARGKALTKTSMKMKLAPKRQAAAQTSASKHGQVLIRPLTYPAQRRHNPSAGVVIESHGVGD